MEFQHVTVVSHFLKHFFTQLCLIPISMICSVETQNVCPSVEMLTFWRNIAKKFKLIFRPNGRTYRNPCLEPNNSTTLCSVRLLVKKNAYAFSETCGTRCVWKMNSYNSRHDQSLSIRGDCLQKIQPFNCGFDRSFPIWNFFCTSSGGTCCMLMRLKFSAGSEITARTYRNTW